jgi:hypothetical protein
MISWPDSVTVVGNYQALQEDDLFFCDPSTEVINLFLLGKVPSANRIFLLWCDNLVNSVTLWPVSGELINGAASYSVTSSAEWYILYNNGRNWIIQRLLNANLLTTAGGIPGRLLSRQLLISGTGATYTKPAGVKTLLVQCWGGGGGGGGAAQAGASSAAGSGGGSGGYAEKLIDATSFGTYLYTIGAAGGGGAAGANNGTAGGNTTFDDLGATVTAKGGGLGNGQAAGAVVATVNGGAGAAVSTGGDVNGGGMPGGAGITFNGTAAYSGAGGSTSVGGGGFGAVTERNGVAGSGRGSGGGGGCCLGSTARSGGAGTAGLIVVSEFS